MYESEFPYDASWRLAMSSVGFLVSQPQTADQAALVPAGSGVICRLSNGVIVVVTAAHVARFVMQHTWAGLYGIPAPPANRRAVEFHTGLADSIEFGGESNGPQGPDIAILKPPPDAAAKIASSRVVYDLSKRQENPLTKSTMEMALVGLPSTAFSKLVEITGTTKLDEHTLMVAVGSRSNSIVDEDGFDRFEFRATHQDGKRPPTYQGVSGGGVWLFDGDDPKQLPWLAGIAYHQSDMDDEGNRVIYCAGAHALYSKAFAAADERWGK